MSRILLVALLCCSASAALAADDEAPRRARNDAALNETPDGCITRFLCYRPPTGDELHPELKDKLVRIWILTAITGPFFGAMWQLTEASKPVLDDGTLLRLFILL